MHLISTLFKKQQNSLSSKELPPPPTPPKEGRNLITLLKFHHEMQKNNVIRLGFMGHFLATKVKELL